MLIDSNPDLIGCYRRCGIAPDTVADASTVLAEAHGRGGAAHYYEVRDAQFNPEREARRTADGRIRYTPELAAMFIYLNRTGIQRAVPGECQRRLQRAGRAISAAANRRP